MGEERRFIYKNGSCYSGVCQDGAACQQYENGTYTCICTHDSLPPPVHGTCNRRIVDPKPVPIPGVVPPNPINPVSTSTSATTLHSTTRTSPATLGSASSSLVILLGIILMTLVILFIIFLFIRKKRRNITEASPINLKQGPLLAERYALNPQYSACTGAGVPVLRKETLKFINEIGEGCFGKVYKGELLLSEQYEKTEIVAIKVLKETATREAEEDFLREVEIMSAFTHPNILSLLGVVLREGNVSPMMVFEFMPHGDLAELLRSQRKTYDDVDEDKIPQLKAKHLLWVALQIARGMRYLAAQRFVHRDLACRNCLVSEGPTVKIADFGMSRDVYTCDYYKIGGSRLLPVRWMSPESVVYGRFTLESDIWSFGVVLWEIYSFGKQPYYGHSNEEVVKLILDGIMLIPPEECPSLICELMKNCWKTEPRHRITFPNICDKLELTYEKFVECEPDQYTIENEVKKFKPSTLNKSLPRPPRLPMLAQEDLVDAQGYLLPKEVKEPAQYLETLPD
ncbi:tyrosine-protein kinase transmembrane receptor Ror [Aethina tumida]|uniref:tyrosine-protein kinase transmembrane receptor Ror n=1 Tax=Aethina tumida TaxID=116153 RepID=UPI002148FD83|nr:tyrosine-protein kinase transmembrane receptor Ror [Aethina tumida]